VHDGGTHDGGTLRLFDKRRLEGVRLEPRRSGPVRIGLCRVPGAGGARARASVKARLLDQSVLAGVGNLLADERLQQARLDPRRRLDTSRP
jgi:formamidopyrimidine-DNA glycosylase